MHEPERLAVRGSCAVGVVQGRAHAPCATWSAISSGMPPSRRNLADVGAVQVLHREEQAGLVLPDVVDLDDVLVMERGGEPRFLDEHRVELAIARERGSTR